MGTFRATLLLAIGACLTNSLLADDPSQIKLDEELITQIRRGAVKEVERLLDQGANPNAELGLGGALQYAAGGNHLKMMRMLIERGAEVNAIAADGRSALVEAASLQAPDAVKILLAAGARPTAEALAHACWLNREECVEVLLEAGVSPDAGMASAGQGGHMKLLQRLLAKGANVDATSPDGNTALHTGALQGGVDVVRLLLQHGADPNAINNRGETPLHMAIKGDGLLENVRLLLDAKASPNVRDKELVSPVRLAAIRGQVPAYRLLLEACGGEEPVGTNPEDSSAYKSEKTTRQLIVDTASNDFQIRRQAALALVARGGAIMPEVMKAFESQRRNGQFYEVLVKLGPEAEAALPKLSELLADKHDVVIARLTMDGIQPGHFAHLPLAVREQADTALYEALIDAELRETARYFRDWLTDESQLKLLRSPQPDNRAIAVAIRRPPGQQSAEVEAELISILLSDDEQHATRERAARALGSGDKLGEDARAALFKILKAFPPYASDISEEQERRQHQLRSLSMEAGRALATAGPAIIDDLLPLVTPLENHVRPGAMEALSNLGPAGVPRMIELLAHEDKAIVVSATVALNRIGKPALPALINALDSENEQVRRAVEGIIRNLETSQKVRNTE